MILALVFIVVLALPYLVDVTAVQSLMLTVIDVAFWLAFAVDYFAKLYLAVDRWRYVRTHVLDLVIVAIPVLRPLRALRLLRLTRIAALLGVTHRRAERSLHVRVISYVLVTVTVLLLIAAFAMTDAERDAQNGNIKGFPDGLWWAISTVTTVGYGDRYPTTGAGRLVAGGLMIVGIALIGVITATIAAWFVDRLRGVQQAQQTTEATLADMFAALREVRERLDTIERRQAPADEVRDALGRLEATMERQTVGAMTSTQSDERHARPERR
jgi:voltage-gated potassium channel